MQKNDLIFLQQKVATLRAEGKYKETIENSFNLLEKALPLKDYKSIMVAYFNLASSYYIIGDIEEAFSNLTAYNEICESHGDEADILNSYNILFILHNYNENYNKAKDTLEKSIALATKLKKYNVVGNGYSNYSHLCMIDEDYIKAFKMATIGLEMAKRHEPAKPILELRVKLNIAKALIGLKDFDASKSIIDDIINDSILDSFIREKAESYDLQGHWYSNQKLYREAFEAFSQAKTLIDNYNDVYLLKMVQEERCKLCDLMEDVNLGYKVQKEYILLLNEISKRELALTALRLEIEHNVAHMEKKSNTDYLTGLYNRDYIETTTNSWLKRASEKRESILCIVFDIDGFKFINDEYGHLFGDEVIKQVSKVCSDTIRDTDLIGRYGGDEFVIILRGISIESGRNKAQQILEKVRILEINKNEKQCPITISIGVTDNSASTAMSFNEIFHIADKRMYRAKQNGKNQIVADS